MLVLCVYVCPRVVCVCACVRYSKTRSLTHCDCRFKNCLSKKLSIPGTKGDLVENVNSEQRCAQANVDETTE